MKKTLLTTLIATATLGLASNIAYAQDNSSDVGAATIIVNNTNPINDTAIDTDQDMTEMNHEGMTNMDHEDMVMSDSSNSLGDNSDDVDQPEVTIMPSDDE